MRKLFRQKLSILSLLVTLLVAGGAVYVWCQNVHQRPQSLYAVLDYYGFKTPEQKSALRFLMQKAGIKDANELLNAKTNDATVLRQSILDFVRETQDKFTMRNGKQERWDVQSSNWMKDKAQQPEILEALTRLNMLDSIAPASKHSDVICVLGASNKVMVVRLAYTSQLVADQKLSAQWLVLLTGERYVTPDKNGVVIDGSEQTLAIVAAKLGKKISTLTETDLMKEAYQASKLYNKLPTVIIDTPRRDLPRPTTATTIVEFSSWLAQHPEIKDVTFVSNQPHVEYQQAIIAQVLKWHRVNVKFEVIGPEYNTPFFKHEADKINYILQALGSRIWAATPAVLDALKLE